MPEDVFVWTYNTSENNFVIKHKFTKSERELLVGSVSIFLFQIFPEKYAGSESYQNSQGISRH